jgi:hypothetical protein
MPPDYTKTIARWFVNLGSWKMRACAASKWGWTLKNRDKVNCHRNSKLHKMKQVEVNTFGAADAREAA